MATVAPSAAEPEGGRTLPGKVWLVLRMTGESFIADDAWSRAASIAYFTLFSVAPTLLVVIAVAGLAFGQEAARGAIVSQLGGLMGRETAEALQAMIRSASDSMSGAWATVIGLAAILLATTGVFGEVQSSLNTVWKAQSRRSTLSRLVRARIPSMTSAGYSGAVARPVCSKLSMPVASPRRISSGRCECATTVSPRRCASRTTAPTSLSAI